MAFPSPFFTRFCVVLLSDACACRLARRIAVGADAAGGDTTGFTVRFLFAFAFCYVCVCVLYCELFDVL